jgi:hypothetical protein
LSDYKANKKTVSKKKEKKPGNTIRNNGRNTLIATEAEKRLDILAGAVLFALGVYHSILYLGYMVIPNSDFPDFFRQGRELLLYFQLPQSFKHTPVLGVLQNLFYPIAWGASRELTAGCLLNATVHPFTVVLFWLVGKRIIGRSAVWFAIIASINPWTISSLVDPVVETPFLFFILLTVYLIFIRSRWAYLTASITSMVRYEGAALIAAAFVADIINRKDKRDILRAFVFSAIASIPLMIWMTLTVLNWRVEAGTTNYFHNLLSKDYTKTFGEGQGRRGIGLHLRILWQVAFQPLLIPYPGAGESFSEMIFKLGTATAVIGSLAGCVVSVFRRSWFILILLLCYVPYFLLHAYYPWPLPRFHSTVFWIPMLIVWLGLQSIGGFLADKARLPWQASLVLKLAVTAAAGVWFVDFARNFGYTSNISPTSTSMPYVTILAAAIIIAAVMFVERPIPVSRSLCAFAVLCLVIASNQFVLVHVIGDGKREIEFKQLGEWFAKNAKPGEKMAVYNCGPAGLYAGKFAGSITGFPKEESPEKLTEKLLEQNITYVVWATREGVGNRHNDYAFLNLDKNIAMLSQPRSIGPYEFVTRIGSQQGYVNVFRLRNEGK